MRHKNNTGYFFVVLFVLLAIYGCGKGNGHTITISGSTTMGPYVGSMAEIYEKTHKVRIAVTQEGSLSGLACLQEGKCDIADSSIKIPPSQLWEAQNKGLIVKEFILGYDIIIPVIHPSNPVSNLFMGQLSDIFTGLIKDWKNAGGTPGKIIVADRDSFSGTKMVMSQRFFESDIVAEGSVKIKSDKEIISYVKSHSAAIGYISLSNFDKGLKAISINGFNAGKENVENGYYPLYRGLYLYTTEKKYKGEIKLFIDFMMGSKGQDQMQKIGFFSVSRMKKPPR